MNKKLFVVAICLFCMGCADLCAQGIFGRIKDRVQRKIETKIEDTVANTASDAVDSVVDSATDAVLGSEEEGDAEEAATVNNENEAAAPQAEVNAGAVKSDFVRGGTIMFQDDLAGEQIGEFPSKWDLVRGNAEVATINGVKCIALIDGDGWITPLVKGGIKNYLGDVFTIEYDMLFDDRPKDGAPNIEFDIMNENERHDNELFTIHYSMSYDRQTIDCDYVRPTEEGFTHKEGHSSAREVCVINDGRWHHFALSFNQRAIKFYVDGKRVVNVPNAKAGAGWFTLWSGHKDDRPTYVKNVVVAKGAVELYGRTETDMSAVERSIQETGKFVTNNILFKTGKADLLPESMAEIEKVADYKKKNPSVRFEVQGHTDNQGSDAVNDPLSQKRAEAVVKALEGLGVDGFNLRAVGKGSHEPVASNSTDEGRAKNRRVEFIKK